MNCPIALAIRDAMGGEWFVNIDTAFKLGSREAHKLPLTAASFVREYDDELSPKPFSFTLDL